MYMNMYLSWWCLATLAICVAVGGTVAPLDDPNVPPARKFALFKHQFNKVYATGAAEAHALQQFLSNEKIILEHNAGNHSYTLGHNEFSDLSWPEFKAIYLRAPMPVKEKKNVVVMPEAKADSVDWVAKGAVTPVKNQGQCGSCWAFSTTGSVEGAFQIAGNPLTSLSEECLVQCAGSSGNQGCNGGLMDDAFQWIEKNGIATEEAYPYTSGDGSTGSCQPAWKPAAGVTLSGFADVAQGSEAGLVASIATGPTSVAIEADGSAFQMYKSGVFDDAGCGRQLDHGVLAVGYGTLDGKDYYKVKNSWGTTWGEGGYILMKRGIDICGIADSASRAQVGRIAPTPPPAPTPPTPPPTPPPLTHYGDPFIGGGGCMEDEAVQMEMGGAMCCPRCALDPCPTDKPPHVTAKPGCVLPERGIAGYCALQCDSDDDCGLASCLSVPGVGGQVKVCVYSS